VIDPYFAGLFQVSQLLAELQKARATLDPEHRAWIAETLRVGGMPTVARALHEEIPRLPGGELPFDAEERLSEPT
jgi:hypothetical protein